MIEDNCWIPDLRPCKNLSQWNQYSRGLYDAFKSDWLNGQPPKFLGKPVQIRYNPKLGGREEGYWHLTCRDYDKAGNGPESRNPDIGRCERIKWPRAFVENYQRCGQCHDGSCSGIIMWQMTAHNGRLRYKLFHRDESYLVVLEERPSYFLLITAFYVTEERELKSIRREYNRSNHKEQEAPEPGRF